MDIDLRDAARGSSAFTGGLLTVLLSPSEHTLEQCVAALAEQGVRAWTQPLEALAGEEVVVAGVPSDQAPTMDALGEVRHRVLAVLDAAGIDVDVHGVGYLDHDQAQAQAHALPG
ncbi:hypothetical protein [Kineococcus sp. SYSU DK005]|uniref:hypothetical protein n=1 Tax=Kineococcus sp. SYSU DK005 TaxID=3383126 RepID=UPI003D7EB3EF